MKKFEEKSIDEKISTLIEDEDIDNKNWSEGIQIKLLILLPLIIVLFGVISQLSSINILSLFYWLGIVFVLIAAGVLILFWMGSYRGR